jgi:hypothetical protein
MTLDFKSNKKIVEADGLKSSYMMIQILGYGSPLSSYLS